MATDDASERPGLVCYGNITIDDVVLPDGSGRPGCIGGDALYAVLAARAFDASAQAVAPVGADIDPAIVRAVTDIGLDRAGLPVRDAPDAAQPGRLRYRRRAGLDAIQRHGGFRPAVAVRGRRAPRVFCGRRVILCWRWRYRQPRRWSSGSAAISGVCSLLIRRRTISLATKPVLYRLIGAVDIFMPSEEEVFRLLGHKDWPRAARELARAGPALVLIKRGAHGVLLYDKTRGLEFRVPAYNARPAQPHRNRRRYHRRGRQLLRRVYGRPRNRQAGNGAVGRLCGRFVYRQRLRRAGAARYAACAHPCAFRRLAERRALDRFG